MKHRLLISLLVAFVCAPAAWVAPASASADDDVKKMTGDEIIAKHLEAVGGKDALAKLKTRVALGTVSKEDEPAVRFAVLSEAPNRISVFYGFRDYDLRFVYDGERTRIAPSFARQYSALTAKYEEIVKSGLMFNQMSLYNQLAAAAPGELKFEAKGTKKIEGRPAHIVQMKGKKGSVMKLYFDAESFMWVRTDYGKVSISREMGTFTNDIVNQSAAEVTIDFYIETSDFRDVDGVKLPFKFQQVLTAPILRQRSIGTIAGTIREYKHNTKIDPQMFQ